MLCLLLLAGASIWWSCVALTQYLSFVFSACPEVRRTTLYLRQPRLLTAAQRGARFSGTAPLGVPCLYYFSVALSAIGSFPPPFFILPDEIPHAVSFLISDGYHYRICHHLPPSSNHFGCYPAHRPPPCSLPTSGGTTPRRTAANPSTSPALPCGGRPPNALHYLQRA